jgi:hypothetical protein
MFTWRVKWFHFHHNFLDGRFVSRIQIKCLIKRKKRLSSGVKFLSRILINLTSSFIKVLLKNFLKGVKIYEFHFVSKMKNFCIYNPAYSRAFPRIFIKLLISWNLKLLKKSISRLKIPSQCKSKKKLN